MARILSLADGTVSLLPRGLPAAASNRITLADLSPDVRERVERILAGDGVALGKGSIISSVVGAVAGRKGPGFVPGAHGDGGAPVIEGAGTGIPNWAFHNAVPVPAVEYASIVASEKTDANPSALSIYGQNSWIMDPANPHAQAQPAATAAPQPSAAAPIPINIPGGMPGTTSSASVTPAAITTQSTPAAPAPASSDAQSRPFYPFLVKTWTDGAHTFETRQLSDDYVDALGSSLERLASMTLARKLRSPAPIDASEASMMVCLAGVPNTRAGQMLTDRILTAGVNELGKGDIIGSITGAVRSVAQKVVAPVTKVIAAAAPILNKIPVVGPAIGTLATIQNNAVQAMANGNIKSLTEGGIAGTIGRLAGGVGSAVGAVVSVAGAGAQGIIEAPGTIASDVAAAGTWAYNEAGSMLGSVGSYLGMNNGAGGMFSSLISGGKSLISSFDSSVVSAIEGANPALSGELTSIFHGLGSEYTNFQHVFDSWSASMKGAPTGVASVGKINGQLYSMVKDALGHISVTQTPLQNAPAAMTTMADGALVNASQLSGLGVKQPAAGSGYGPGYSGSAAGLPTNPAGVSLPGGPISVNTDPTSLRLLAQAAAQANAGKSPAGALSPQLAGFPLWAVAGLGVVALMAVLKPGASAGPMMSMGQGWQMPVRRVQNKPRRKSRRGKR